MTLKERCILIAASFKTAAIEIFTNRLTLIIIAIAAVYWLIAMVVDPFALIDVLGYLAVISYLAVALVWFRPAVGVLRSGRYGGVAQMIVGLVLFVSSQAALRTWSNVWRYFDFPQWMVGSPWLGFLILWTVVSAVMMITGPNERLPGERPRTGILAMFATALISAVIGASAAVYFTRPDVARAILSETIAPSLVPSCSDALPIWGNAGTKTYHTPDSPWRRLVKPEACFANEDDAKAAGYRPAGVSDD